METNSFEVVLGLGTNLGNKSANLQKAISLLCAICDSLVSHSKIYETPPWGFSATENFYNMAIKVKTRLSPFQLLVEVKAIELKMGRPMKEGSNYSSRIIDIDIIDFDQRIILLDDLIIPHPMLSGRSFVLFPLKDIMPSYTHPKSSLSIDQLLEQLNDKSITVVNIEA